MGGTMGAGVGAVSSVGRDPCFPAGTPVLMADGTTRPIEDVAVGDHVACTDPGPLSGDSGPVGVTVPSERYAFGIISVLMDYTTFPEALSTSASTWTVSRSRGVGGCSEVNRHSMYRIRLTVPQPLNELPLMGTHLLDVNFGLDRLVSIATQQSAAWRAR